MRVRWDDFGEVWDADLSRADLIIARRLLRTLNQQAAAPEASPRRWTDQSGEFEVVAFLVAADGDQVQLRKPDGTEISVPINQLSDSDQTVVDQLASELP